MVLAALCPCISLLRHGCVQVCVILLITALLFLGELAPRASTSLSVLAALCPCSSLLRHGRVQVCVIPLIAAFLFFGDLAPQFGSVLSLTVQVPSLRVDKNFGCPCDTMPVLLFARHGRVQVCVIQYFGRPCGTVPVPFFALTRARPNLCDTTDRSILVLWRFGTCNSAVLSL